MKSRNPIYVETMQDMGESVLYVRRLFGYDSMEMYFDDEPQPRHAAVIADTPPPLAIEGSLVETAEERRRKGFAALGRGLTGTLPIIDPHKRPWERMLLEGGK